MNLNRQFPFLAQFFKRWGGFMCVSFIWFFCFLSFISIWHFVFLPFEMWATWGKLFLLVGFHFLVALCLSTYARITRADPGFVDPNWTPEAMEEGGLLLGADQKASEIVMESDLSCTPAVMPPPDVKDQADVESEIAAESSEAEPAATVDVEQPSVRQGEKNFCAKCSSYRVGHNNLKLFILWLWYGTAVGSSFMLFFGFRIYDIYLHRADYETNDLLKTGGLIGLNLWLGLLLTLNLCGMGFNMTYLALTNTTTVERIFSPNKYRARRRARNERWKPRHKYDLGPYKNIQQVFGTSRLSWVLPTEPETDGYHSPTNPKWTEELAQESQDAQEPMRRTRSNDRREH